MIIFSTVVISLTIIYLNRFCDSKIQYLYLKQKLILKMGFSRKHRLYDISEMST